MSNIPGLLICPVDGVSGEGIKLPSFTETIIIPESHRYGNCRTVNDFEKLGTIAEGSFGVLYKCKDRRTNELYVLKKFKMPSDLPNRFLSSILREINILNTLKHVNLVNSHGIVAGRNLDNNYLILDYGVFSLKDLIERNVHSIYEMAMVKSIMQQLFNGLVCIHGGLIIHRNICCKNIIFTSSGILKITGFCSSRFYAKGNMTPRVSELGYRAPELLFQTKVYGPAIDMWSAGCVFAELILKKPIFSGSSELEVLQSITGLLGTPSEQIWPGYSELFSQMDERNELPGSLEDDQPYSDLKKILAGESAACKDLMQELLVYYPNGRVSAPESLDSPYFADTPQASSYKDMASILKTVGIPDKPTEMGN